MHYSPGGLRKITDDDDYDNDYYDDDNNNNNNNKCIWCTHNFILKVMSINIYITSGQHNNLLWSSFSNVGNNTITIFYFINYVSYLNLIGQLEGNILRIASHYNVARA